jgi:hypothetical protein
MLKIIAHMLICIACVHAIPLSHAVGTVLEFAYDKEEEAVSEECGRDDESMTGGEEGKVNSTFNKEEFLFTSTMSASFVLLLINYMSLTHGYVSILRIRCTIENSVCVQYVHGYVCLDLIIEE